jgi:hypothetical protein
LKKILNDGGGLKKWVEKAKDKEDSFRLMGSKKHLTNY